MRGACWKEALAGPAPTAGAQAGSRQHTLCCARETGSKAAQVEGTVQSAMAFVRLPHLRLAALPAGGGDWHMAYLLLYRAQRVPAAVEASS